MKDNLQPPIYTSMNELVLWTLNRTADFPKSQRFTFGHRIDGTTLDALALVVRPTRNPMLLLRSLGSLLLRLDDSRLSGLLLFQDPPRSTSVRRYRHSWAGVSPPPKIQKFLPLRGYQKKRKKKQRKKARDQWPPERANSSPATTTRNPMLKLRSLGSTLSR